jgi:hypothetical protein
MLVNGLLEVAAYLNYMCLEIQFLLPCKSTYRHKSVKHIDRVLNDSIRRPENLSRITDAPDVANSAARILCEKSRERRNRNVCGHPLHRTLLCEC